MNPVKFIPEKTYIPVSGKVFDKEEINNAIEAAKDGWWTEGRFAEQFEREFKKILGVKYVSLTNSGSSANLLALSSLCLKKGSEVITTACGFPTTVNPIIQNGCIPVFVDVDLKTKNADLPQIKKAVTKKTKAIILAHTLGNPFEITEIQKIAKNNRLFLIEDCCDALGSTFKGKPCGTFGDIATFSFYPAHQITMGEGGAVITNNPLLHRAIRQFRDWGRDCWCDTGKDNTCSKRFSWQLGKLPFGYDHKYIYSKIGYNLRLTDFQAAIGAAQLKKLPNFIEKRKENFEKLFTGLKKYEKYFILPQKQNFSDPAWFGFMLVIKDSAPFTRLDIVKFLESKNIGTRSLFGGNLTLHPAYQNIKYKKIGDLKNSTKITYDGFWIGIYPGITSEMIDYILEKFDQFFKNLSLN